MAQSNTAKDYDAEIAAILAPLPAAAALAVLHKALGQTLARLEDPPGNLPRRGHKNRSRFPWLRSRIDQDPEVKTLIRTLAGTMPVQAMRAEVIAHFGTERAPSKSALHRYLLGIERE